MYPRAISYWAAESFDKVIRGGSFKSLPEEAASYARNKNTPIEISDEIDTDKIEANYQEGVLTVRLSKKDLSKAEIERKIDIK